MTSAADGTREAPEEEEEQVKKKTKCFFFHDWGNWVTTLVYERTPYKQSRVCERCGKAQVRYV